MSYNTVLNTSMPAHYLVRSPFWQPTVYPLTGYTSPLHTPYHSCICYYQHVEITPAPWGGLAQKKLKQKSFFFFFNLNYMGCTLCPYCLVCVSRVDIEIKKNIFNCAFFVRQPSEVTTLVRRSQTGAPTANRELEF